MSFQLDIQLVETFMAPTQSMSSAIPLSFNWPHEESSLTVSSGTGVPVGVDILFVLISSDYAWQKRIFFLYQVDVCQNYSK